MGALERTQESLSLKEDFFAAIIQELDPAERRILSAISSLDVGDNITYSVDMLHQIVMGIHDDYGEDFYNSIIEDVKVLMALENANGKSLEDRRLESISYLLHITRIHKDSARANINTPFESLGGIIPMLDAKEIDYSSTNILTNVTRLKQIVYRVASMEETPKLDSSLEIDRSVMFRHINHLLIGGEKESDNSTVLKSNGLIDVVSGIRDEFQLPDRFMIVALDKYLSDMLLTAEALENSFLGDEDALSSNTIQLMEPLLKPKEAVSNAVANFQIARATLKRAFADAMESLGSDPLENKKSVVESLINQGHNFDVVHDSDIDLFALEGLIRKFSIEYASSFDFASESQKVGQEVGRAQSTEEKVEIIQKFISRIVSERVSVFADGNTRPSIVYTLRKVSWNALAMSPAIQNFFTQHIPVNSLARMKLEENPYV